MSKIRRIQDFQHSFSFSSQQEQFGAFFDRFLESDLGKIYRAVPWDDMAKTLGLKEAKKGPRAIFPPRGKVALMFLKHYTGCLQQDEKEDQEETPGVDKGTAAVDRKVLART